MSTVNILPEGYRLAGRYEIVRLIGQGGMGVVYLAKDTQLDDELRAIKMISPQLLQSPKSVARLKKEAKACIRLTHPNIVRILNYEESQGTSFIVMEYVDGQTLESYLVEKGKLGEEDFLGIAGQVCSALDYAHQNGIIHQDIKPANIFIAGDGSVKLADFGIARVMSDTATQFSGQMTSGTLAYMSPEMIRGKKPTAQSDIYSLANTFYELLNGEAPFTHGDITYQHLNEMPGAIGGVSLDLNQAIFKGLAKEPEQRPAGTMAFWAMLSGEKAVTKPAPDPLVAEPPEARDSSELDIEEEPEEPPIQPVVDRQEPGYAPAPRKKRSPVGMLLGIIILLAVIAGAVATVFYWDEIVDVLEVTPEEQIQKAFDDFLLAVRAKDVEAVHEFISYEERPTAEQIEFMSKMKVTFEVRNVELSDDKDYALVRIISKIEQDDRRDRDEAWLLLENRSRGWVVIGQVDEHDAKEMDIEDIVEENFMGKDQIYKEQPSEKKMEYEDYGAEEPKKQ
jgi:serine/threonine protein kinase